VQAPPPVTGQLPAPTGLSATLHGLSVNIGWGAIPGAKDYEVEVFHHNSVGTYGAIVAHQVVAGNHVAGLALPGGGQYAVRVRAHDPAGAWTDWKVF
jgi:hypothetical protein